MATEEGVLEGTADVPPPTAKAKVRRRRGGASARIPTSSIINFSALILLFVSIALLQQFGGRFSPEPERTRGEVPSAAEKAPAVEQASAEGAQGGPAGPAAKIASVPVALAVPPPPAEEPLPPPAAERPPVEQAPPVEQVSAAEKPAAEQTPPTDAARGALARGPSVEELDGEPARKAYLAANRGIPKVAPPPEAEATPADDFIPFERR